MGFYSEYGNDTWDMMANEEDCFLFQKKTEGETLALSFCGDDATRVSRWHSGVRINDVDVDSDDTNKD